MNKMQVIIADPHELFREGLRLILGKHKDFDCVATASDIEDAVRLTSELNPDLLLLDICIAQHDIRTLVSDLKAAAAETHIVILSHVLEHQKITESFLAGADGYLMKDMSEEQLLHALRTVGTGEQVISPVIIQTIVGDGAHMSLQTQPGDSPLKERELEVVRLAAMGGSNKEIALELAISEHTVASHLISIFKKLGVRSRAQAVARCLQHGWFSLE